MVCRDITRGEEARQEIISQTGNQVSVCRYSLQAYRNKKQTYISGITSSIKKIYIYM